jgi:hypothetical protein
MRFLPKNLDTIPLTNSTLDGVSIGLKKCATKLNVNISYDENTLTSHVCTYV